MNASSYRIEVDLARQVLKLLDGEKLLQQYLISTAKNGAGETMDSECTPRGRHIIAEKIGDQQALNTVFVGRRASGETYSSELKAKYPERDWILTRILWLRGEEAGRNLHDKVDTYNRYIYIHGTPDDVELGKPGSHGCIRMSNEDIVELFDLVQEGTRVDIREN